MDMVQVAFDTRELAMECKWDTFVLLLKGGGDYHGIGLVEVIWKVVAIIIDRLLAESIEFHDVVHGFRESMGMGEATLEAKLLQTIAVVRQAVLYKIF